jgi:hypothetical protein
MRKILTKRLARFCRKISKLGGSRVVCADESDISSGPQAGFAVFFAWFLGGARDWLQLWARLSCDGFRLYWILGGSAAWRLNAAK